MCGSLDVLLGGDEATSRSSRAARSESMGGESMPTSASTSALGSSIPGSIEGSGQPSPLQQPPPAIVGSVASSDGGGDDLLATQCQPVIKVTEPPMELPNTRASEQLNDPELSTPPLPPCDPPSAVDANAPVEPPPPSPNEGAPRLAEQPSTTASSAAVYSDDDEFW